MTRELLKTGIAALGFIPAGEQIEAFGYYLAELKKWNRAYNLTGITKDEDIIIKHFIDSLLYLKALPAGTLTVADIGSGAGFPGIPMKIIRPDLSIFLIEPSGKKTAFLRHIIRSLWLEDIGVIEKRIEDVTVTQDLSAPVDAAVTRALFDIRKFIGKASHIVRSEGFLILSKGPKVQEEVGKLKDRNYEILPITLPLADIQRYLVIVRR